MLALDHLPEHLIVLGGSYIGLEFAQMYRRFGAFVTVIEKGPRLVPREDEDISEAIRGILEGEGVAILTDAAATYVSQQGKAFPSASRRRPARDEILGSDLLLAIGRRPNTDDTRFGESRH